MSEPKPDTAPEGHIAKTTTPIWEPTFEVTLWSIATAFGGLKGKTEQEVSDDAIRAAQEHPAAMLLLLGVLAMRTRRLEATHAFLAHIYEYTEPNDRAGLASRLSYTTEDGRTYRLAELLGLNPDGTLEAGPDMFAAVRLDT